MTASPSAGATIKRLRIENYRVLRNVRFDDLTPLTVLLGPNGSGKSTVFDVFAFLHEAWFFGDVPALHSAFPRVPASLFRPAGFRDPDAIRGGTWEALERVLGKYGYHQGGLAEVAAATEIAEHMDVDINRSRSFQVFRDGIRQLVAGGHVATQD